MLSSATDLSRRSEQMATQRAQFATTIEARAADFGIELAAEQAELLADYYELLMKWNERLHLTAPCSPQDFAIRHVLESLMLLSHLFPGATVVDVGSGGGLPIIPCLLVRQDLRATLIESSERKTVFLREALRPMKPSDRAQVINARFEEIDLPPTDFLTCRAIDRFSQLLPTLIQRAQPTTTMLLFTGDALRKQIQSLIPSATTERIPHSQKRFLIEGKSEPPAVAGG
jgi:16S rRNA (guanine527-N7)-methyltransferase